ncbi:MAG: hypothetical protein GKC00_06560 [Candidatus Methanofastidiosa archaeon]|nr:hypothetical protein [Candidatus Methanofastidiosa archaeon]
MKLIRFKYHLNSIVVLALFLLSWVFFIYIKVNIPLTYHESTSQGYILTVTTLLFSFLVGHYFNSRYERYISIRDYHLSRHSRCISLIDIAQSFSENRILLKKLYEKLNDIAVIDELCSWSEGYIEEPYYRNLYCLLDEIKIIDQKDLTNYRIFYDKINEINELTRKLNSLGRDKFGFLRWLLLGSLAAVIILLTLFVPISNFINIVLLMLFPPIIFLVIYTINSYQNMTFHKESTSMEINEKIFDEIGKKRFYKKERLKFVRVDIRKNKNLYITEDELEGKDKDIYLDYLDKGFYVSRSNKKQCN